MKKIITYLSLLKKEAELVSYEYGIEGKTVNEAVLKYILNNDTIDEIILLVSDKVKNEKLVAEGKEVTTIEYIEEIVAGYCTKNGYNTPIITEIDAENEYDNIMTSIASHLDSDDELYFDLSGGFRDIAVINMLLINLSQFKGVRPKQIIYTEFKNNAGTFKNMSFANDMILLISAANEFSKYGKCKGLNEYVRTHNVSKATIELIDVMKKVSENIELGRASGVEEDINILTDKMNMAENESGIFSLLIPTIRNKFFGGIEKLDWLNIILWCVENDMINQALTFFVEKAPDYIFENEIIKYCGDEVVPKSTLLYERLLDTSPNNQTEFRNFIFAVKGMGKEKLGLEIFKDIGRMPTKAFGECLAKRNPWWLQKLSDGRRKELTECTTKDKFVNKITNAICFYNEIQGIEKADDGTYTKKVNQIKNLPKSQDIFKYDLGQAKGICTMYLYAKIIRNHICHVSEEEIEKDVAIFLKENGCDVENISVENIKENIVRAVNIIKYKYTTN